MSEAIIFAVGSLLFIAVTWATIVFGVRRVHELYHDDLERSDRIVEIRDEGFTERYVTVPAGSDRHRSGIPV